MTVCDSEPLVDCCADEPSLDKNAPFGFWVTTAVGALSFVVSLGFVIVFALVLNYLKIENAKDQSRWILPATVCTALGPVILFALVCWRKGGVFRYCRIKMMSWKLLGSCMLIFIGMMIFTIILQEIFNMPAVTEWQDDLFAGSTQAELIYIFIAVVILAPIWEELFFRGFVHVGWLKALGPIFTVALLSLVWALFHQAQYSPFYLVCIFIFGVVLGLVRIKTDNLTPCIFLHFLNNLFSFVYTLYELKML